MPSTIPYDPSMVLGGIIDAKKMAVLEEISMKQAEIDNESTNLNQLIMLKRKLTMTIQDLASLDLDAGDLAEIQEHVSVVSKEITQQAVRYAKVSATNHKEITRLKGASRMVSSNWESPIDYNKSQIKQVPIAADTITFDAQYFSMDMNQEDSHSHTSAVKSFVSLSTANLGEDRSQQMSKAAQQQTSHQSSSHDVEGTLIITASVTHKQAMLFAPFILNVDKGIRVFNKMFPDDAIKPGDATSMMRIAMRQDSSEEKSYQLLSGAAYGSSFVGMVHILKTSMTESDQNAQSSSKSKRETGTGGDMNHIAGELQQSFDMQLFVTKQSGGVGVDNSLAESAMAMLSTFSVNSHVSMTVMGIIPTIKSSEVQYSLSTFADKDPMKTLSTLANATAGDNLSMTQQADIARTGADLAAMKSAQTSSVLSSLSKIDGEKNQMLDINTMMTAFSDFVDKSIKGNVGVPINYFVKPITASLLAQMWVAKYLPGKFVTMGGDDSEDVAPAADDDD